MKKQNHEPVGVIHAIEETPIWPGQDRHVGRWQAVFAAYDKLRVNGKAMRVRLDNISEASRCATAANNYAQRVNCKAQGWRPQSSSERLEDGTAYCYLRKVSINGAQ